MSALRLDVTLLQSGERVEIGVLQPYPRGGADFTYTPEWLSRPEAFALSPSTPLVSGRRSLSGSRGGLPAVFADSAPDRWGRGLIARGWRADGRTGQPSEVDYLLGFADHYRLGALRYEIDGVAQAPTSRVPKVVDLAHLEDVCRRSESDQVDDDELSELLDAGSSLGGARPKANVADEHGHLMLAKFTATGDEHQVVAWEKVCLDIAERAGIAVPRNRLLRLTGRPVLLMDRFDRDYDADDVEERLPYLSAMALLNLADGGHGSMVAIAEELQPLAGADVGAQLGELWSRAALNLLVGNTDNHLRNHGLLRRGGSWQLSPVFDVTPATSKNDYATAVDDEGDDTMTTLLSVSELFELDRAEALDRLAAVTDAVAGWRDVARSHSIPASDDRRVAPGFEGQAWQEARTLLTGHSQSSSSASSSSSSALSRCSRCGRPLRAAESVALGLGPGCREK